MRILVSCDCGAEGSGEPGATYTCPACGLVWRMPPAAGIVEVERARRTHRLRTVASLGAVVVVAIAGLVLSGVGAAALGALITVAIWVVVVWPALRRRHASDLEALPPVDLSEH